MAAENSRFSDLEANVPLDQPFAVLVKIDQREGGTLVIVVLLQVPEAYSKPDRVLLPVDTHPL